jgi:hypothetical protein
MYPDVIELQPGAMVLLAGINDVSRNTGPSTAEMIEQNIMAMTELAQHHGTKIILCSLLPVSDYPFLRQQKGDSPPAPPRGPFPSLGPFPRIKMTEGHPAGDILKLNAWMKEYANRVNANLAAGRDFGVASGLAWMTTRNVPDRLPSAAEAGEMPGLGNA